MYPCRFCSYVRYLMLPGSGLYPAALRAMYGTRWGYINDKGRFVFRPQYQNASDFQANGLAIVEKGSYFGVIDQTNRFVVWPEYQMINPYSEGLAAALNEKGYVVLDERGKVITSKIYSFIGTYHEGRVVFGGPALDGEYLYGYLDTEGKEIIPQSYMTAGNFASGKALVKLGEGKFALIDPTGNILQDFDYADVGNPGDGLLSFMPKPGGKYGYIDTNGKVIIQPGFSTASPFEQERAVINMAEDIENKYGLIDTTGHFVIQPIYNSILRLGENRVGVGKAIDPQKPYLGSIYALADSMTGSVLTGFIFTDVTPYHRGYASAATKDHTFFIDENGEIIKSLPMVEGTGTLSLTGSLVKAEVDMRTSYFSRQGRPVWSQNTLIPLNAAYYVLEKKYKPNKDYLVYYPQVQGINNPEVQNSVNKVLMSQSGVKPIESDKQLEYSYTGDFSITFFKKQLLVLLLEGYNFPFGAAHGMPSNIYPHIDLVSGKFYQLKDLFKPGSDYVKVISDIIGEQIKNDPKYDYVFPEAYQGIKPDQPFYVKSNALHIYFEPYEIAPYAAGFPTFTIPFRQITALIDTQGDFWQSFH